MPASVTDPFGLSVEELHDLLSTSEPYLPELEAARDALAQSPQAQVVLAPLKPLMDDIEQIPQTTYTQYRQFVRNGDRIGYQTPYFEKRTRLAAAVLHLFLDTGEANNRPGFPLRDVVQDLIWDICEETNWVVPAHEWGIIDLFAAETGFVLAETLALLGDRLDGEVRARVRREMDRRIFEPFLRHHRAHRWYFGPNNWNGVCNSSIAAAFCLLQPDTMAQGVRLALDSLDSFLDVAFEADGSSTEGVSYWHYGLINFVALAELLRARSRGGIDLLDSARMRRIAAYPGQMHLSGSWFASFSDCDEQVRFNPGILTRLAERTGETSLLGLIAPPAQPGHDWRLTMMLRNLLWWDGSQPAAPTLQDATLPQGGVARLVASRPDKPPVVLAIKAGHNGENHNQNDVGSFIVHVDGENLLTDPGRGLYDRAYFSPQRYENVFANSYGHSVPRFLDGADGLQAAGAAYGGELLEVGETSSDNTRLKQATIKFGGAYALDAPVSIRRQLSVTADNQDTVTLWLKDSFAFEGDPLVVEEAFITWFEVETDGASALIRGQKHTLRLTIEAPTGAEFALDALEEASRANHKPAVLKRLTFRLPAAAESQARVRMEVARVA